MIQLIDWLLNLLGEPEPEPTTLADNLAFLAVWRHPRYQLSFECVPCYPHTKLTLQGEGANTAETYIIGVLPHEEIAEKLTIMANHVRLREGQAKSRGLDTILDFTHAGRDC